MSTKGSRKSSLSSGSPSPSKTNGKAKETNANLSSKQLSAIADQVAATLDNRFKKLSVSSTLPSPNAPKRHSMSMAHTSAQALRFKDRSPPNIKSVEICATARKTKADTYSGQLYVNTDDRKVNREFKLMVPAQSQGVKRIQAKGRRVGGPMSGKTLEKLEMRMSDRLLSLKPMLEDNGYNPLDELETDVTEMARLREGSDRVAFERIFAYRRRAKPGEEDDVSSESEVDEFDESSDENDKGDEEVDVRNATKKK